MLATIVGMLVTDNDDDDDDEDNDEAGVDAAVC
jgi:hypothetical protein